MLTYAVQHACEAIQEDLNRAKGQSYDCCSLHERIEENRECCASQEACLGQPSASTPLALLSIPFVPRNPFISGCPPPPPCLDDDERNENERRRRPRKGESEANQGRVKDKRRTTLKPPRRAGKRGLELCVPSRRSELRSHS